MDLLLVSSYLWVEPKIKSMKNLLTALILIISIGVNAQHQSLSAFDGVLVFRDAKTVMNQLLAKRPCSFVSSKDNSFTLKYQHIGFVEILKFFYNPTDSVIYKTVGTIPAQDFVDPFVYYGMMKDKMIKEFKKYPYEYNDNPNAGEVYAKWQNGSSFITISVNYRNEVVHTDESLLETGMFKYYYSKPYSR